MPMCAEASLVVFSAMDHLWSAETGAVEDALPALQWLVSSGVPLVLVSRRPAAEVLALHGQLRIRHPFVCDGGGALHVPSSYFPGLPRLGTSRDPWNVLTFGAPHGDGHAVRLLASLYRLCSTQAVIVGVVHDWGDRALLHEADVPVVVRTAVGDDSRLVETAPNAYLTHARGAAGWSEAILGSLPGE
jgi:predicted mannosyl-3-phosphoglycerate phosphatase (HAD superfamily)